MPKRHSPPPKRHSPGPKQHSPEPKQHSPGPKQHSPEPKQHSPTPKRHSPTPKQRHSSSARRHSPSPEMAEKTDKQIQKEIKESIQNYIKDNNIFIFSKSFCPYCQKVKNIFDDLQVSYEAIELDKIPEREMDIYQDTLKDLTGQRSVPNIFIGQEHIGGCDSTVKLQQMGKLDPIIKGIKYDFDLVVIGGGSGGIAAAKEAANDESLKIALCDFVDPSPQGTTWGLGGTCVNVGCIPKKLMHRAANFEVDFLEAPHFGWELASTYALKHNWEILVSNIQDYICSLNFGYRKTLMQKKIKYFNCFAEFIDPHTLKLTDKSGNTEVITTLYVVIAVGGRPAFPIGVPGARRYSITSDDLFSLKTKPEKILIVGASYIALECAGFLKALGCDVTVMVRSILLRGFDQQMAELVGNHLSDLGVKFIRECVPIEIKPFNKPISSEYKVLGKYSNGDEFNENFNVVMMAIGRNAYTEKLNLTAAGVKFDKKNGKIFTENDDRTNVGHIFALGDVAVNRPELTPVAIQAGNLLAKRIFQNSKTLTDYCNVPTTVFTPLEYGCVGLSEEKALEMFGTENVEVYHTHFQPLEFAISKRDNNKCYAKLICIKPSERVVGFHILSPNAGEITQGFSIAINMKATKKDFDKLIGIHPTCAEVLTTLTISKSSGLDVSEKSC